MPTITITEALVKIKNIDSKLNKAITETKFIASHYKGKSIPNFGDIDLFRKQTKATYDSIMSLIKERTKLKSAIVESNAKTQVTVSNKQYSVASCIERKHSIKTEELLISTLVGQRSQIYSSIEQKNKLTEVKLDQLLNTTFGNNKPSPEQIKVVSDSFWNENETVACDPLDITKVTAKLSEETMDFLSNVDVALTISNSTTTIDI